jgi:hypothetical protein
MAHAQKPDFVFRQNGRVHLNRPRGGGDQFSRVLAAKLCASAVSNVGYTMFRGSVKSTGYPLHSPVSPLHFPSRASPSAITFQLDSTNTSVLVRILSANRWVMYASVCACVSLCTCLAHIFMVELLKNCGYMGCDVMGIPTFQHNLLPPSSAPWF